MFIQIVILVVGFFILIKGADIFVDGASSIAKILKVPTSIIALTVVSFGTSVPELAVSFNSLTSGSGDLLLGNVIGTNIVNVLLIIGVSSLVHSLYIEKTTVKKELPLTLLMTVIFAVLMCDSLFDKGYIDTFTRSDGLVITLFFTIFIWYLIRQIRKSKYMDKDDEQEVVVLPIRKSIIYTIVGIIAVAFGSNFVVDSSVAMATHLGVSEKMIGLTILAIGTSLPELVTSVQATKKGEYGIAIGNVVGSNLYNLGLVIGVPTAILGGIGKVTFNYIDLIVFMLSSFMLYIFASNDRKIDKREGILFLIVFIVYYAYIIITGIGV